jgi:hypothetical protein
MDTFAKRFPHRFFQCGVAEANMIGVAAGLAGSGFIPFVGTFANFATGRVYDQIRQSVCYSGKAVKIAASHAGLTLGEDGATHQMLEDIGLMRGLPGMTVISPCDYNQTRLATLAAAYWEGPVYLRFGRPAVPNFTPAEDPSFQIGKIQPLLEGKDGVIFATGHLVWHALQAAYALEEEGLSIAVVNVHTLKPVDVEGIAHYLAPDSYRYHRRRAPNVEWLRGYCFVGSYSALSSACYSGSSARYFWRKREAGRASGKVRPFHSSHHSRHPKSPGKSMIYLGVGSNEGNRWEALAYAYRGSFIGWGASGGLISYL